MEEKPPLDIFTIPTLVTLGRLVISPFMAKRVSERPAETWKSTAAYVASDVLDGLLAKGGEWLAEKFKPLEFLPKIGFRKSEFGRKMDPVTDKLVIPQIFWKGMKKDIIPKPLGYAALAQKAGVTAITLYGEARGTNPEVSDEGRHAELLTNLAVGFLFAAEGIEDPRTKKLARAGLTAAAAFGVNRAAKAAVGYAQVTRKQLAQQRAQA